MTRSPALVPAAFILSVPTLSHFPSPRLGVRVASTEEVPNVDELKTKPKQRRAASGATIERMLRASISAGLNVRRMTKHPDGRVSLCFILDQNSEPKPNPWDDIFKN